MGGIARHEAMRPLSRHHHHALMEAMNIRKAMNDDNVNEETLEALRESVLQFWKKDGNAHFREEEEILIPAYARYAPANHEELLAMWLEHVEIRALIAAIDERDGELAGNLSQLSEKLEKHVRREERVIFPMIEKALPEEAIRKLAPYFHEFHHSE